MEMGLYLTQVGKLHAGPRQAGLHLGGGAQPPPFRCVLAPPLPHPLPLLLLSLLQTPVPSVYKPGFLPAWEFGAAGCWVLGQLGTKIPSFTAPLRYQQEECPCSS